MRLKITGMLLLLLLLTPSFAMAAQSWSHVTEQMQQYLDQSYAAYQDKDTAKAKELLNEAYYGPFESERMEQAIRTNISSKRAAEIEFQFNSIRKKMTAGTDEAKIKQEMDDLMAMVQSDAKTLEGDQEGWMGLWFYSFLIILREGVEAILIIAAIVAYLVKSGNGQRVREVYQSTAVAIGASLITAYLFQAIFQVSGAGQEVLEGAVLLFATVMLFSMSYWMFSKADSRKWKHYIQGKVQMSLTNRSRFALWFAVFLAVYREGAETVLFYQALLADSTGGTVPVWLGILAGSAILIVLFWVIRAGSMRIPLKPFFFFSSALMYLLAFIFAGEGIKELQAGGLVSMSEVPGFTTIGVLGIYPSWEGIAAQAVMVLLLIIAMLAEIIRRKQQTRHPIAS